MPVGEKEWFHGVVLFRLVQEASNPVTIERVTSTSNSAFLVNSNTIIYPKYSTKRLSPWPFQFSTQQFTELAALAQAYPKVFLLMICGRDGIVSISWDVAKDSIIRPTSDGSFSMLVSRRRGHQYRVTAARSSTLIVADSDFPRQLLSTS